MMGKEGLVKELHKPSRKNFFRRRVVQKGLNDTWQIDLIEMIPYSQENKGFKYILTVIDIFSKYAYAVGVKNKTASSIANAMKNILLESKYGSPKNIQSDQGSEFFNKDFKKLMKENNINHYHSFSKMKASIVERFNRTLKNKIWPRFSQQGSYNWILNLDDILKEYNNTRHRTIKMKPKDVNPKNENRLLDSVFNRIKLFRFGKFKRGDFVRISKEKGIFSKGYLPNWSTEIFKVENIKMTYPVTYVLKDLKDNIISGAFYEQELQKTKYVDTYLVEKIVKRKGDRVLVKWLGFDNSENSWIHKNELL